MRRKFVRKLRIDTRGEEFLAAVGERLLQSSLNCIWSNGDRRNFAFSEKAFELTVSNRLNLRIAHPK